VALVGGSVGLLGSLLVARRLAGVMPVSGSPSASTWLGPAPSCAAPRHGERPAGAARVMLNPFTSSRDPG